MKVLSVEFTPAWSWGLIFAEMKKHSAIDFNRVFLNNGDRIKIEGHDMILSQNITLLKKLKERIRTVCRLGGNQNFDNANNLEPVLLEMSKCFCLIATNNKLYEIAKSVNDNAFMIPNGINLEEWTPIKSDLDRPFTVGFCGNISNPKYREYKGYDFVSDACFNARIQLKTALYKENQIEHSQMRQLFYGQIDCIVHPTLGEGCSNTLMEAAACGIPIITTRCAGFHGEMMVDGKNVLFCERSVESIQEAIERVRDDKKLQKKLSSGARKFAEKHHDVTKIVKQYEKIFKDCVDHADSIPASIELFRIDDKRDYMRAIFKVGAGRIRIEKFPAGYSKEQILDSIRQGEKKNG
ncbi:MAG: glycosyltransferase family 4 protein [Lentisphaerota bacterium]